LREKSWKPKFLALAYASTLAVGSLTPAPLRADAFVSDGGADCPSHASVASAVRALLAETHFEINSVEARFELKETDSGVLVVANGRQRELIDRSRDCVSRTRAAAVFVALSLAPPDVDVDTSKVAPKQPASEHAAHDRKTASGAPHVSAPSSNTVVDAGNDGHWHLGAELGASGALSLRSSEWLNAWGAEIRLVLMKPPWGISAGTVIQRVEDRQWRDSKLREGRFPVDLALRLSQSGRWLRTAVDVGAVLESLRLRRVNSTGQSAAEQLVNCGAKVSVGLQFGPPPLTPFLRTSAEFFPPRAITLEPAGRIDQTSWIWLSASAGVAGSFD
jgi:hypothetical protein